MELYEILISAIFGTAFVLSLLYMITKLSSKPEPNPFVPEPEADGFLNHPFKDGKPNKDYFRELTLEGYDDELLNNSRESLCYVIADGYSMEIGEVCCIMKGEGSLDKNPCTTCPLLNTETLYKWLEDEE